MSFYQLGLIWNRFSNNFSINFDLLIKLFFNNYLYLLTLKAKYSYLFFYWLLKNLLIIYICIEVKFK